jgi:SAM-dependent methyltransferase
MSETVFTCLKLNIDLTDEDFNRIYPPEIQLLAKRHWTPVEIAKKAADFLVPFPGAKVLDIGSGAGKFCLVGASSTRGHFTGVEQRGNLVELSTELACTNEIHNVRFLHANITEVDFSAYHSFYFYNSFHENIDEYARIDDQVETGKKYYTHYTDYLHAELSRKPVGTRLVTYWSLFADVPANYELQFVSHNEVLKFWEKTA